MRKCSVDDEGLRAESIRRTEYEERGVGDEDWLLE